MVHFRLTILCYVSTALHVQIALWDGNIAQMSSQNSKQQAVVPKEKTPQEVTHKTQSAVKSSTAPHLHNYISAE